MSTKKTRVVEPVSVETEVVLEPKPVRKPKVAKFATGVVTGCTDLNVRDKASVDGNAVCQIKEGSEVTIELQASTDEWFKIKTSTGVEGFCMKNYIEVK